MVIINFSLQGVVGCHAADGAGQRSGSSGEVSTAAGRCHPQQYHNPQQVKKYLWLYLFDPSHSLVLHD